MSLDADILADVFASEGASTLKWEQARRCTCWSEDTHQPSWHHEPCGGTGVLYDSPREIKGLFRSQSRWFTPRPEGELDHGEASLTLPLDAKPHYLDRRVRDRFTVVQVLDDPSAEPIVAEDDDGGELLGDAAEARVFFPAANPVPFMFNNEHLGWRVQLQALNPENRVRPQG